MTDDGNKPAAEQPPIILLDDMPGGGATGEIRADDCSPKDDRK